MRYKTHKALALERRKEMVKVQMAKQKIALDVIRLKLRLKLNNESTLGSSYIVFKSVFRIWSSIYLLRKAQWTHLKISHNLPLHYHQFPI